MTIHYKSVSNLNPNSNSPYYLRQATFDEAYEIWSVMDICYQTLEHKEYFICDDLDYVKDILSGHGLGVVACDETGKIVGNLLVKYPGLSEENLGYDVFIPSPKDYIHNISLNADDCNQVITAHDDNIYLKCTISLTSKNLMRVLHMDSASVLPEHRGHGLERRMIAFAETLVDTSKYHYAFATVAPENTASLKSLEKNGYQVMVTKDKYGEFVRSVMMKALI